MKEIIIIGAYADTDEKIRTLDNLILFLKKHNKTILLSSHLTVPSFIIKNVDYFIYDKENKMITDKKYFGYVYYQDDFIEIYTRNAGTYNTSLAVLRIISNGVVLSKSLGYNVIHYMEYDTELNDISEINENFEILNKNEISSIGYKENIQMLGNYFCFNIDKLDYERFVYNEKKIKELILENGICETLVYNYLLKAETFLKDYKLIRDNNFKTQLVQSGSLNWGLIFEYNNNFFVFCYNNLQNQIIFNVLVDNKSYNFWLSPNTYRMIQIKEDAQYIKIFGNNRLYNEFDLKNEIVLNSIRSNTQINKLNIQFSK